MTDTTAASERGDHPNLFRLRHDIEVEIEAALEQAEFIEFRGYRRDITDSIISNIAEYEQDFSSELEKLRSQEAEARNARKLYARIRRRLIIINLVIWVIVIYELAAAPFSRGNHGYLELVPTLRTVPSLTLFEAMFFASGTLATVYAVYMISTRRAADADLTVVWRASRERYEVRLRNSVMQQVRLKIPTLNLAGIRLEFEHTPALVELSLAEIVSTNAVMQAEEFVVNHTASALGIAGPRGAGKTTILRYLTAPKAGSIAVYVPAPVRYESNELLVRIFELLATAYLGKNWQSLGSRRLSMLGVALSGLLTYAGIGAFWLGVRHYSLRIDSLEWTGAFLLLLGIFGFIYVTTTRRPSSALYTFRPYESRQRDAQIRQARRVLEGLRWQQQRATTDSIGSAPWSGLLNVARQRSTTLTQREIGRPRLVGDFQDFVRMVVDDRAVDRVIIAIDELDKLPTIDDATAVVTELKDILHIEGTHVIVSVSEEVLDRFVSRGIPRRDVFDSSFDEIIEVPLLSATEAVRVLQSRATAFPREWALICYALSGGVTRDLLRYARRCVALYRTSSEFQRDNVLDQLVGEVARERVLSFLRAEGVLARLTDLGRKELALTSQGMARKQIQRLMRLLTESGSSSPPLCSWLEWAAEVAKLTRPGYVEELSAAHLASRARALARI
jgi:hypothetical protein